MINLTTLTSKSYVDSTYQRTHPDPTWMAERTLCAYQRWKDIESDEYSYKKDADIIVMDEELNIRAVWAMGKLVRETDTLS